MPTYRYPENVGTPPFDKFIKFDAKQMRHVLRNRFPDTTVASAVIYLPETALRNTLAVTWNDKDLGTFPGLALQLAGGTGAATNRVTFKGMQNTLQTAFGGVEAKLKEAGWGGTLQMGVNAILTDIAGAVIPDELQAAGGSFMGLKANPRTEVLFDAPQYRTYNLEFMMVPHNYREGAAIDNIVKFFQFYMLPVFYDQDTIVGYPYEFEVGVFNNTTPEGNLPATDQIKRVAHIGRCVIKNVTVDQAAGGKVAFVRDASTGAPELFPVATMLSLELQEVRLLARTDPEILRGSNPADFPDKR